MSAGVWRGADPGHSAGCGTAWGWRCDCSVSRKDEECECVTCCCACNRRGSRPASQCRNEVHRAMAERGNKKTEGK